MPAVLHAFDYLSQPRKHPPRPVCVVFGDEPYLKREVLLAIRREVLGAGDGEFQFTAFEGPKAAWREVLDELSTLAMFGEGKRLALVDEADEFVTRYRPELEDYAAKPRPKSVLVLDVKQWPSTTKLYKKVVADGLPIECKAPKPDAIAKWLVSWAPQKHRAQLASAAAELLVDLVGPELGLLDQELEKLALLAGSDGKISADLVQRSVGGWRAKTAWDMLDAALAGNAKAALLQLDRLLLAGEHPIAVLGQIGASLRRFAAATRLVMRAQAERRRVSLQGALEEAGIKSFVLRKAEQQLRQLGAKRGEQLYRWLLEADMDLKGQSALAPRTIMERLLVRLAAKR
ncbi:MAG: DNA polymerase III subunit delta [Pirellulales bacterium]